MEEGRRGRPLSSVLRVATPDGQVTTVGRDAAGDLWLGPSDCGTEARSKLSPDCEPQVSLADRTGAYRAAGGRFPDLRPLRMRHVRLRTSAGVIEATVADTVWALVYLRDVSGEATFEWFDASGVVYATRRLDSLATYAQESVRWMRRQ